MEYRGTAERFAKARMENFLWKNRWRENFAKNDPGKVAPYPSSTAVLDMRIVQWLQHITTYEKKSYARLYHVEINICQW